MFPHYVQFFYALIFIMVFLVARWLHTSCVQYVIAVGKICLPSWFSPGGV